MVRTTLPYHIALCILFYEFELNCRIRRYADRQKPLRIVRIQQSLCAMVWIPVSQLRNISDDIDIFTEVGLGRNMEDNLILVARENVVIKPITHGIAPLYGNLLYSRHSANGDRRYNLRCSLFFNISWHRPEENIYIAIEAVAVNIDCISCSSRGRYYIPNPGRIRAALCIKLPHSNTSAGKGKRWDCVCAARLNSSAGSKEVSVQIIRILSSGKACRNSRYCCRTIRLPVDRYNNDVVIELPLKHHCIIIAITNHGSSIRNCVILLSQQGEISNQLVRRCIGAETAIGLHEDPACNVTGVSRDNILLCPIVYGGDSACGQQDS